jgi:hypothetical protein
LAVFFALAPGLHAQESTASAAATSRSLVNSARSAAGLPALADDARLDAMASAQAQRMADRDAIYHNPNLKSDADAAGVNWQWIGENVGVGPDVQSIHDGFMASPGHHENIVYRDYNVIGTGAAVGRDGSIFIAQVFVGLMASSPASSSPAVSAAPAPVAAASAAPAASHATTPVRTATPTAAPVSVAAVVVTPPPADANAVVGGVVDDGLRF